MKVVDHQLTVIIFRQDKSPQILEGGDWGEGDTKSCDIQICTCLYLLLLQATPLPFLSPLEKFRYKVPDVEGLVLYKHVTLGAPGVRSVNLLQDHYCVPRLSSLMSN